MDFRWNDRIRAVINSVQVQENWDFRKLEAENMWSGFFAEMTLQPDFPEKGFDKERHRRFHKTCRIDHIFMRYFYVFSSDT